MAQSQGITLLALGDNEYGFFARNMAASIKAVTPGAKIQLLTDNKATRGINLGETYQGTKLFDQVDNFPSSDSHEAGRFSPGKAKIHIYDHLAWDHSIYLDVDGCCISDISDIWEKTKEKPIVSHVWDYGTRDQGSFGDLMYWADAEPIWTHYQLPDNARLPFLNTSFISVQKGAKAESIYRQAQECLDNPMPLTAMRELWGKGNQPDELYMNIAMAIKEYEPHSTIDGFEPMYFRPYLQRGPAERLETLKERHHFLGLWGGVKFNHRSVEAYYDGVMRQVWAKEGATNVHKTQNLMRHKFVSKH